MKVFVTGASGFVGSALVKRLVARGDEVIVASREPERAHTALGVAAIPWDSKDGAWGKALQGADGIVNLAGEPLAQRWTNAAKDRVLKSRVEAASRIESALRLDAPAGSRRPAVLVNASAVGYYGAQRGDTELDEEASPGSDFLAETCVAWEQAAQRMEGLGLRVVLVRTGLAMGPEGGALAKMLPPFRLGVGGPLGSGRQWVPWIHRDDLVSLLLWALETPGVAGPLNATAPSPVRMLEFASTLARVLKRPCLIGPPAPLLKLVLGEMSALVLEGQRVVPRRTKSLGFSFRFEHLEPALQDLLL